MIASEFWESLKRSSKFLRFSAQIVYICKVSLYHLK